LSEARSVLSEAKSMTGFASVEGTLAGGRGFVVTVKSVNHRHLDLQVRMPVGFDALEAGLRSVVKAGVKRGHVELTILLEKGAGVGTVQVDEALLGAYVEAHRRAAERFGVAAEIDLNGLLRMPGVMSAGAVMVDVAEAEGAVMEAASRAVTRLNEVRTAEGTALVAELRAGMSRVLTMAEEVRTLREGVRMAQVDRLRGKLAEMLGEQYGVSDERLLTEAALLVERGDVEEELVRLRTHVERFNGLLDGGGELGRQLDFLLQELNREANTMLSKTGGSGGLRLTELGLAMKVELERAREQVQNLE
jgi:uncharacterized protein (TIGR00255 family)